MHIPDGYLGPATYGTLWAAMVPIWGVASRKVKQNVKTAEVPYLAMGTVFSLMAMMFVLPIPGGTTGHISGTTLVAILLGPWAAIVAVSISLAIQALVMGDGGITAIAPNCFNIAVLGAFSGAGIYRLILAVAVRGGEPSAKVAAVAAAIAAYVAMNIGALSTACLLGLQPLIYGAGTGSGYFPFPLEAAVPATMLPHLTVVGALEATVTALVLIFLKNKGIPMKSPVSASRLLCLPALLLIAANTVQAHSINYQVEQRGMAVRAYYSEKHLASYSQYELYGPGDKDPYQTGRTDRKGYIGFVPDRPGVWKLQVWGESTHGFHGVTTKIKVDKALELEGFNKPMVAAYTKYVTGISLIFGIFGIYSFWLSRRKENQADSAKQ